MLDYSKFIKIVPCSWCGKSGGEHPICKKAKSKVAIKKED